MSGSPKAINSRLSQSKPDIYKRRPWGPLALESLGKGAIEESELENHPNGSAGINGCARLFRFLIRSTYIFMDQNSKNIANIPGAKWEVVTPHKLLTDTGISCGSIGCDPEEI